MIRWHPEQIALATGQPFLQSLKRAFCDPSKGHFRKFVCCRNVCHSLQKPLSRYIKAVGH